MIVTQSIKTEVSYDPAIPILGLQPKELKAETGNVYAAIFIATLYIRAKRKKQYNIHHKING